MIALFINKPRHQTPNLLFNYQKLYQLSKLEPILICLLTTNFNKIHTYIYNLINGPSIVGKKFYDHTFLFSFYYSYIIHSSKLQIIHMYSIHILGINGLNKGIGPWAAPEDIIKPDDKHVVG